eukprot:6212755-Pleurochrysis_carterae.AAC.3
MPAAVSVGDLRQRQRGLGARGPALLLRDAMCESATPRICEEAVDRSCLLRPAIGIAFDDPVGPLDC